MRLWATHEACSRAMHKHASHESRHGCGASSARRQCCGVASGRWWPACSLCAFDGLGAPALDLALEHGIELNRHCHAFLPRRVVPCMQGRRDHSSVGLKPKLLQQAVAAPATDTHTQRLMSPVLPCEEPLASCLEVGEGGGSIWRHRRRAVCTGVQRLGARARTNRRNPRTWRVAAVVPG